MDRLAAAAVFLLLLTGCAIGSSGAGGTQGDARAGSHLFVHDRCVQCHQVNGAGGSRGPDLTHYSVATNVDSLKATLANPPEPMRFVKKLHLTDRQIRDLSAFTDSNLKPAP